MIMRFPLFCVLLVVLSFVSAKPPYPVFETDKIPNAELKQRRQNLKDQIGPHGIAIFFTNPERNRNNDCDFRFRADSSFLYLTGFEEPDAALLLVPGGLDVGGKKVTEVLFCNLSDKQSETWLGYRMGPDNAMKLLGFQSVLSNTEFAATLKTALALPQRELWAPTYPEGATAELATMAGEAHTDLDGNSLKTGLDKLVGKMRMIKSDAELRLMRRATDASAASHIEAMRVAKPGMREYELQALLEYGFARRGCESVAYNSIVGSGPNGCILHYEEDRRLMRDGDLVCIDAAGEYHGYAADITRTYPLNGHFSPAQRAIYEIVFAAQQAGIDACKPGASFRKPHEVASETLARGLLRLGIIKNRSELDRYFPHGTSHTVGLDVHDSQTDQTLHPNEVLTVEPGLYIKAGSPCDPKWWNIGIRIEDDILVTSSGHEVLSAKAPKSIGEIEKTMRSANPGPDARSVGKGALDARKK